MSGWVPRQMDTPTPGVFWQKRLQVAENKRRECEKQRQERVTAWKGVTCAESRMKKVAIFWTRAQDFDSVTPFPDFGRGGDTPGGGVKERAKPEHCWQRLL